ncbi:MAG: phosphosulfolactate synthase [Proteobacteria bacterium]|nr:phosphosulfolactate synthase [Desulfobacula sp.]MBU3952374.1 phosphosulfolactate synthase [Pseudomonadota bacterium]MBU4131315.1 phosphosulfolactate synthase [Pseudomonadota bacterium]
MKKQKTPVGKTLTLTKRYEKPREKGLTAITDIGVPLGELVHILGSYHSFVDLAKLGVGSAYIEPCLREKIKLYADHDIPVYFGGTLFEKYYHQAKLDDYLCFLDDLGIEWIEVSDGTIDMQPEEMIRIIERVGQNFKVLTEVGKKEETLDFTSDDWTRQTLDALTAGSAYVVLEGRNTADAGIYDAGGRLDRALIRQILATVDQERLIIEAPTARSQSQVINLLGGNVNLGNIFVRDLLLLESQRQGLRENTFFVSQGM